jgi:hypothetical protein
VTDEKLPPIDKEIVAELVLEAHGDLGVVKQLVEYKRELVNAAWDWGGGDWETDGVIPLRAHAEAGGEQAREVLDLLETAPVG